MKGISIAIETIIFIILAVTVLSVLLLFLTGVGGPPQLRVQWEAQRTTMCFTYASIDPSCSQANPTFDDKANLVAVCKKLEVGECTGKVGPTTDSACLKACCKMNCPK